MTSVKIEDLISSVRYIIDEQQDVAGTSDTFDGDLDNMVQSLAARVLQMLMQSCPVSYFSEQDTGVPTSLDFSVLKIGDTERYYISITLPDDYLRFFSLTLDKWRRPVTELSNSNFEQSFAFSNINGTPFKPKVYLKDGRLMCFSVQESTVQDSEVQLRYIKIPAVNDSGINVPARLKNAYEYFLASEVLKVLGETERSKSLMENVKLLIQ
jgi:hypothetical protein